MIRRIGRKKTFSNPVSSNVLGSGGGEGGENLIQDQNA
jgi:hypothetical protein